MVRLFHCFMASLPEQQWNNGTMKKAAKTAAFFFSQRLDYVLIFRVRDSQGYAVRRFFLSCVKFNVGLKS